MDAATRMFRVRRTCLEMLRDRGYGIAPDDWAAAQSLEAFKVKHGEDPLRDDMTILVDKAAPPTDPDAPPTQIFVFFPEEPKVGVKTIKTLAERMRAEGVARALMVVQAAMTPFAKQCLAEMAPKYIIELFQEAELLVNITKHVLVPEHRVLKPEEKKALLERYRAKDAQLPRIQHSDPVARYYGMARGEVVRIVRPSETAGRYVTYRLCL